MALRLPTALLAFASLSAVGLDLALTAPIAHGDGALTAAPIQIPAGSKLTGDVVDEALVDGVEARVLKGEDGTWTLALHNPGAAAVDLAFEVTAYEVAGMTFSRMGPVPQEVNRQPIAAMVPPGATVAVALEYRPTPVPAELTKEEGFFRATTFDFGEEAERVVVADAGPAPGLEKLLQEEPTQAILDQFTE